MAGRSGVISDKMRGFGKFLGLGNELNGMIADAVVFV